MIEQIFDIVIVVIDIIMFGGFNGCQFVEQVFVCYLQMCVVLMSGYSEESEDDGVNGLFIFVKFFVWQDFFCVLQCVFEGKL